MKRSKQVPVNVERLRVTRWAEGYDVDEVDAFLDRVEPRLAGRPDPALADEILAVRFTPVRIRAGYDQKDVDDLLDVLERRARTGS